MNLRLALALVCLAGVASAAQPAQDNSSAGPAVPLPTYRVDDYSSHLGFAWKATLKEDRIETIRFSRVDDRSLALRAGLQVDDRLVSINQQPVAKLPVSEFQRLFYRDWKPGDTLTWDFVIERGTIVPRRETVTLRLRTRAPTPAEPEAKAEPAAEQ